MTQTHDVGLGPVDLENTVRHQLARDRARARTHARELSRYRGVSWSGLSPGPFPARDGEALLIAARRELTDLQAWRSTENGAFLSAVAQGQSAAQAAHAAGEAARAAAARDFAAGRGHCLAAAQEMLRQARAAWAAARRALEAARTAPAVDHPARARQG